MHLAELEVKLLRLALDPGAHPGEVEGAALRLIMLWRRRGLTIEAFQANGAAAAPAVQYYAPDYGLCKMPFGKHKDKEFKDIPPSYLRWLLNERRTNPNPLDKHPNLNDEIEQFLNQ